MTWISMALLSTAALAQTGTTDTGTATGCWGQSVSAWPTPGTPDAFYRTAIGFYGYNGDASAYVELTGGTGLVPGTSVWGPDAVEFLPDDPLQPNTAYTATLYWVCGVTEASWTTSSTGAVVGDPSGSAYAVDPNSGRFVEPMGVGALIGSLFDGPLPVGPASVGGGTLDLHAVAPDPSGGQDLCEITTSLDDAAVFEDPWFDADLGTVEALVDNQPIELTQATLSGAFTPDLGSIDGAELSASLDVNQLTDLIGGDPCALLATFGVECIPCPDGSGPTCVDMRVDSIRAPRIEPSEVPRTQADLDIDPDCGGTPPDPTTTDTTTGTATGATTDPTPEKKGGADGGCGCSASGPSPGWGWLALLALVRRRWAGGRC